MIYQALTGGNHAVGLGPAQAILGAPARPVFGADPTAVAKPVHRLEYIAVIDLALVRLVAAWHRGALQVADHGQVLLKAMEQIAAHDLHMVEIELEAKVRLAGLGDDVGGVLHTIEEIIRPVAR